MEVSNKQVAPGSGVCRTGKIWNRNAVQRYSRRIGILSPRQELLNTWWFGSSIGVSNLLQNRNPTPDEAVVSTDGYVAQQPIFRDDVDRSFVNAAKIAFLRFGVVSLSFPR
jgi:hypothetical protein